MFEPSTIREFEPLNTTFVALELTRNKLFDPIVKPALLDPTIAISVALEFTRYILLSPRISPRLDPVIETRFEFKDIELLQPE